MIYRISQSSFSRLQQQIIIQKLYYKSRAIQKNLWDINLNNQIIINNSTYTCALIFQNSIFYILCKITQTIYHLVFTKIIQKVVTNKYNLKINEFRLKDQKIIQKRKNTFINVFLGYSLIILTNIIPFYKTKIYVNQQTIHLKWTLRLKLKINRTYLNRTKNSYNNYKLKNFGLI